jgi:hypothetical protein
MPGISRLPSWHPSSLASVGSPSVTSLRVRFIGDKEGSFRLHEEFMAEYCVEVDGELLFLLFLG